MRALFMPIDGIDSQQLEPSPCPFLRRRGIFERLFDVRNQVLRFFEANIEPHEVSAVVAVLAAEGFVGHGEAYGAAPAVADFEEVEGLDEFHNPRGLPVVRKDDREHARRAGEVAAPDVVAGAVGERGVEDEGDFGSLLEPAGDGERRPLEMLEPDAEGLQSAEGEAAVVGRDGEAQESVDFSDLPHRGFVTDGDAAEEEVAVAADVFGKGLHADVDAVGEGVEQDAGGVGVVERDGDRVWAGGIASGGGDDRGNVLHFHRDRAWAFGPNEVRVRADELRDVGADHGVVGFDFDIEIFQQVVGDFAAIAVSTFGHKSVGAGAAVDEIDERDG